MKYLLDTYVWVKVENDPQALGPKCLAILGDEKHELFISPVSTLELAQLVYCKRLNFLVDLKQWIRKSYENLGIKTVPLEHNELIAAYALPEPFHKDPADRILVAVSRAHSLAFITTDKKILESGLANCVDASK